MTSLSRWIAAVFSVLALAGAPAFAKPVPWPQVGSDLPADASVRFGTLPNGMRYAIKRNVTPVGGVSLRLRIDAGSLMEHDNEQGLAHVLEHMGFRGSAHVADGDTVKKLQSLGLTFGADTNAFTYPTQTAYSFDMPKNDAASIDTALLLLREIAGELNIAQSALDTERNVVLAESRLRDVPGAHIQKADYVFLFGERAASALIPIGLDDIIVHANSNLLRGFYGAWYRPERATLLVVGDVDPAEIEAKIKAKFVDWKAKAPPRRVPHYAPPAKHSKTIKLFTEAGAQPYVGFTWLRPFDRSPDNKAREARDVVRYIAMGVLNQRLAKLAHEVNPPFIEASASYEHNGDVADGAELGVSYRTGQMLEGVTAAQRAWREIVRNGVCQDEVDAVVAQLETFFETRQAASQTMPSSQVMSDLLRSVDDKTVFTSPESDLVLYRAAVKGLTAARVSQALKFMFGGEPLVFASTPTELAGGEAAIKAALAEADATPIAAGACGAAPPWPYADFGKPGTVASQRTVDDLGVTYVRFANGVTLTVKPTQWRAGQVLLNVRAGTGRLGLPRDHVTPAWALGGSFIQGGLVRYDFDDLRKLMSNRVWGASLSIGDDEFVLSGQARAADLDSELQVLAAYVTAPAFKPEALDQVRTAYASNYATTEASPNGVFSREFSGWLHDRDARWRTPTLDEIKAASIDEQRAILAPALASGPLDLTIVGDVTVEQAIQSVSRTFGALPPRPDFGPPLVGDERFPKGTKEPVVLIHHGAANQALAAIVWPTQGILRDMKLQRSLRVMSEIFAQRLLDELRTKEGITYTPGAGSQGSIVSPDYGILYALAQIPPDKIADFYKVVASVAADLTATKVSEEELERARGPRIQDIQKQQQTNDYWLSLLSGSGQDPRLLDVIRSTIPDLKGVTADDVQKAAKDWIKDDKAFRLVVVPEGLAPPAPAH